MSGLHTRGYRPEPGERIAHVGTRDWWRVCYQFVRTDDRDESNFDRLARRCLADRAEPEPLDGRRVFYGGTRAEAVAAYPLERS